jgi:hypothetical protein
MKTHATAIREKSDFHEMWKLVNAIFRVGHCMPDQVLNKSFTKFFFEEFDYGMDPLFWNAVIQPLALASGDTHVLIGILDPDPVNYFYHAFGYYNWFKLSIDNETANDYSDVLISGPERSEADAILYNSETVIWVPMSGKWAVWGERSVELCALAFSDNNTQIVEALKNFTDRFLLNYSNKY